MTMFPWSLGQLKLPPPKFQVEVHWSNISPDDLPMLVVNVYPKKRKFSPETITPGSELSEERLVKIIGERYRLEADVEVSIIRHLGESRPVWADNE